MLTGGSTFYKKLFSISFKLQSFHRDLLLQYLKKKDNLEAELDKSIALHQFFIFNS